jgi:hypothetical protein
MGARQKLHSATRTAAVGWGIVSMTAYTVARG